MNFPQALVPGRLLRRYQRFLADVALDDGRVVTAHSTNTGSMMGCAVPGSRVWLSPAGGPGRKLAFTWELSSDGEVLVGVHTGHPNRLVEEAIRAGAIPSLAAPESLRREVKYGERSRIDLLVRHQGRDCYVEVKNVTLCEDGVALFPDAVTERGRRHLEELREMRRQGHRALMVYAVQRMDAQVLRPAAQIDPRYAVALAEAARDGVELVALRFRVSPEAIEFDVWLPVETT